MAKDNFPLIATEDVVEIDSFDRRARKSFRGATFQYRQQVCCHLVTTKLNLTSTND